MNTQQFNALLTRKKAEIEKAIRSDLPRMIGKYAVDHYRENFTKGGFVDNGLHPWQPSRRLSSGIDSARNNYPTLLSSRKELYNSLHYIPGEARVTVRSDRPYSRIHNEGGTIQQTVTITPKMRRFAWAQHYKQAGADKKMFTPWKGLALTKKNQIIRSIKMPKRQFMGQSKELNELIYEKCIAHMKKIIFGN